MGFLHTILKFICCSSSELSAGSTGSSDDRLSEDYPPNRAQSTYSYNRVPQRQPSKCVKFGISAQCPLTAQNVETMYDVEEDMTTIAQRAANSAIKTTALMDAIMELLGDEGSSTTLQYGNKPILIAELE